MNIEIRLQKVLFFIGVILIFLLNLFVKFNFISKMTNLNIKEEKALFSTEMAFHYRHFKMVASGEKIPELDKDIQYPEGLNIVKYETPFMDKVLGLIYKLFFSKVKMHIFAIYSAIIFYSLAVFVLFLGARILFNSNLAAIFVSFFYALTPATIMRNISGFYSREDFALPFMFLSFVLYLFSLKKENILLIIAASFSLMISLAIWHFTQLYLNVFVVGVVFIYFILKINKDTLPKVTFFFLLGTIVLSSIFIPILREIFFIFSPSVFLLIAILVIELFFPIEKNKNNLWISLIIIFSSIFLATLLQRITSGQTHAFGLLFYKIANFNVLPDDPAKLPFEVKIMWAGNTMGDDFITVLINFLTLLILFPISVFLLIRDYIKNKNTISIAILFFSLAYFVLYILINRMSVFASFFLSLSIAIIFLINDKRYKIIIFSISSILLIGHLIFMLNFKYDPFIEDKAAVTEIYDYINNNTSNDAVVLANFEFSPGIALYTGRKVNLHSKFESSFIRKKVEEYYKSLYSTDEDLFYKFCEKNKTDYFVYSCYMALNTEKGGHMYYANALPLDINSNVFKFHFKPESLQHFKLIYQNDMYRVYSVVKDKIDSFSYKREIEEYLYEPIFDFTNYSTISPVNALSKDDLNNGFNRIFDPRYLLFQANEAYNNKNYKKSFVYYRRFFQYTTFYQPQIVKSYIDTLLKINKKDDLYSFLQFATESLDKFEYDKIDTRDPDYWFILAKIYFSKTDFEKSKILLEKSLSYKPFDENINLLYAMTLDRVNQSEKALTYLKKVLSINPKNISALNGIAFIYFEKKIGNKNDAVSAVKKSLEINPEQKELESILNELIKK